MALTGLEIYKLLPKTNCKKCNFPTCLAFAMAVAQKKISIEACPEVSEEVKIMLLEAGEPPIRTITIGAGENKIELGGETVIFRHEKTFYHPPALGFAISDTEPEELITENLNRFNTLKFDRAGMTLKAEVIMLFNYSHLKDKFLNLVSKTIQTTNSIPILISEEIDTIKEALHILNNISVPIGYVTKENYKEYTELAKNYKAPLILKGSDLDELSTLSKNIMALNYKEIILDVSNENPFKTLDDLIQIRRLSIKKNFRPLGFPTLTFLNYSDNYQNIIWASAFIERYSSIIILPFTFNWAFLPLITLRLNIYTDPQKPITVEPKLYQVGGTPNQNSPLLVTSNFSLTYFTVEPEIMNSKIPSWLLVIDTDGLSVLTAYAADKFTPEKIKESIEKYEVCKVISHRKIVIPGYVAAMSGKLSELTKFDVIVGPREASGIPKFLRSIWKQ